MATAKLSTTVSDFEGLRAQLQALLASRPAWKDLVVAGTGQTLLDFVAGVGAANQYAIERAVQEIFLETANSPSSVYATARLLGARIQRRRSSSVPATLTRSGGLGLALSIPAYTQFYVDTDNKPYVNLEPVSFVTGQASTTVQLVEGLASTQNFVTDGSDFQVFTVGNNFDTSDSLVRLLVNGIEWRRVTDGLWNYGASDFVFYDRTTSKGAVELMLGNGFNGVKPPANSPVTVISYAVKGSVVNNASTGLGVTVSGFGQVSGVTTSGIVGGEDQEDVSLYKYLAPRLFAANSRAVTKGDADAIVRTYPGVADCKIVGEADIRPGDYRWMNLVGVVLVTNSPWDAAAKAAFLDWFEQYQMLATRVQVIDAVRVLVEVDLSIVVDPRFGLSAVQSAVSQAMSAFFTPSRGVLGRTLYVGDIVTAAKAVPGVLHVTVNQPTSDVGLLYDQYSALAGATINVSYGN